MKHVAQNVLDLPLEVRADMALKAAVRKLKEYHARAGLPIVIWRDGKVVEISGEELRAELARSPSD